ncbi:MAG: alpha-amylase family glycosyl hydrolase [Oscillospiraceae bacterium]
MPAINAANPDWRKYMITGERSVVKAWLRDGASGWRLDVADELPDDVARHAGAAAKAAIPTVCFSARSGRTP